MAAIELNRMNAILNEGSAVRLGSNVTQNTEGETHVYFEACEDSKSITVPDSYVEGTGRILDVSMMLRNVCPGKRTAVGVSLCEVDNAGNEYARGFRTITIPAPTGDECCDVQMPRVRFVLPEDVSVGSGRGVCGCRRHFIIRTANHCMDTNAML